MFFFLCTPLSAKARVKLLTVVNFDRTAIGFANNRAATERDFPCTPTIVATFEPQFTRFQRQHPRTREGVYKFENRTAIVNGYRGIHFACFKLFIFFTYLYKCQSTRYFKMFIC
jgi:hypothetical protein